MIVVLLWYLKFAELFPMHINYLKTLVILSSIDSHPKDPCIELLRMDDLDFDVYNKDSLVASLTVVSFIQ